MISIRADLTDSEWKAIRKLAIDRNQPLHQLARDALLEFAQRHGHSMKVKP